MKSKGFEASQLSAEQGDTADPDAARLARLLHNLTEKNKTFIEETLCFKTKGTANALLQEPFFEEYARYQPGEAGTFTLNPETQELDFSKLEPTLLSGREIQRLLNLPMSAEDVPFTKVAEALQKTGKYYVPGVEYARWLSEHPEQAPEALKQDLFLALLGSVVCGDVDNWCFVRASWFGTETTPFMFDPIHVSLPFGFTPPKPPLRGYQVVVFKKPEA